MPYYFGILKYIEQISLFLVPRHFGILKYTTTMTTIISNYWFNGQTLGSFSKKCESSRPYIFFSNSKRLKWIFAYLPKKINNNKSLSLSNDKDNTLHKGDYRLRIQMKDFSYTYKS
jgi:hypothetical protein